jgi:hypothetical protein
MTRLARTRPAFLFHHAPGPGRMRRAVEGRADDAGGYRFARNSMDRKARRTALLADRFPAPATRGEACL